MKTANKNAPRRLERYRKKLSYKTVAEPQGRGKTAARAAATVNLKNAMAMRKKSGKLVRELEALSVADLQKKLAEARQELFTMRFKHATAQLENVAGIPAAKHRIARILTLIKQKEVGA